MIEALRDGGLPLVAVGGAAAAPLAGQGVLGLPHRVADAAIVVAQAVGRRG